MRWREALTDSESRGRSRVETMGPLGAEALLRLRRAIDRLAVRLYVVTRIRDDGVDAVTAGHLIAGPPVAAVERVVARTTVQRVGAVTTLELFAPPPPTSEAPWAPATVELVVPVAALDPKDCDRVSRARQCACAIGSAPGAGHGPLATITNHRFAPGALQQDVVRSVSRSRVAHGAVAA